MKPAIEWPHDLDTPSKEREETRSISARQIQIIQTDAYNEGFEAGLKEAVVRIQEGFKE